MEVEAREIATWAENVYVKIPCVTTKGESTAELVRKLSADGIKVNVTTIFTPEQVDEKMCIRDSDTGELHIDFDAGIATMDGEELHLTPIEYKLLLSLIHISIWARALGL